MSPVSRKNLKPPRLPLGSSDQGLQGSSIFSETQWAAIAHALSLSPRESQIVKQLFDDKNKSENRHRSLGWSFRSVHQSAAMRMVRTGIVSRI